MERLCTAEQMRKMDKEAMYGKYAIIPEVLMENAGRAVVERAESYVDGWEDKNVIIFCGKGNNGGDGFVIARHLLDFGASVFVYILGKEETYSEEAQSHLYTLHQIEGESNCEIIDFQVDDENITTLEHQLYKADVVIDAMLGTGFKGSLRSPIDEITEYINYFHDNYGVKVVAVDVPTGVNSDTGTVSVSDITGMQDAVCADVTVTFGHLKRGFCFYPGKEFCGFIEVDPIGMPFPLLAEVDKDRCYLLDKGDLQELLIPRTPDSHKGTHGTIGIVTGSSDMAGAALMAGKGALRAGAGKIFLRVPSDTAAYCIGKIPEIMVKGIGKGGHFTAANAASVIKESKEWDAIAMGPGLGKAPVTKAFIKKVISETTCPIVLDADAINLLKDEKDFIKEYGSRIIMTPHLGEFSRLTNLSTAEIKNDIVSAAKSFIMDWNVTLVLKGASTVIVDSESHTAFINPTGNAGMATAGMGDILTGMITALLCHEGINSLFQAACAAVYLHGAAGDSLMENYGPYGYSALDLADELPTIIAEIENED